MEQRDDDEEKDKRGLDEIRWLARAAKEEGRNEEERKGGVGSAINAKEHYLTRCFFLRP